VQKLNCKIALLSKGIYFLIANLFLSTRLPNIQNKKYQDLYISSLKGFEIFALNRFYIDFTRNDLPSLQLIIFFFLGSKLCFAIRNDQSELIAINLYYFNYQDVIERSIHEGFIAVKQSHQKRGLGTCLRKYAVLHFSTTYLSYISSRITMTNSASLKSAQKLGFTPVETYVDNQTGESRFYLLCDLRNYTS